jgi:hypothetical protein
MAINNESGTAHSAKDDTGYSSEGALNIELERYPGGRPVSTPPESAPVPLASSLLSAA